MDKEDVKETVLALIQESSTTLLQNQPLDLQADLNEIGLDSLSIVEIIFELESRYSLVVDEERMATMETVNDLIDMIVQAV